MSNGLDQNLLQEIQYKLPQVEEAFPPAMENTTSSLANSYRQVYNEFQGRLCGRTLGVKGETPSGQYRTGGVARGEEWQPCILGALSKLWQGEGSKEY